MKYNALKKCLNLAEVICEAGGMDVANVDVTVDWHEVLTRLDCKGAEIVIAIRPKGADHE